MTDRKSDKDLSTNENDEWEFSSVQIKYEEEPKMESQVKDTRALHRKVKLDLNEEAIPRNKTRSEMARELQGDSLDEDHYDLAPYFKRGLSLLLDFAFLGFLFCISKLFAPVSVKIIQFFLDKYKFQLWFSNEMTAKILMIVQDLFCLFLFFVIPVSFFNLSFGKKILGLRVRGEGQYSLSLAQGFQRELIYKPISMVIIAGFVTPFFNKKRLSIHDMMAKTIVIEN